MPPFNPYYIYNMYCSNCGIQLSDGAKFCPSCGTPVSGAAPMPEPSVSNHFYQSEETEEEQRPQKGSYVTKNIVLGTDGKYHWSYKFNMLTNPTILFLLWKMFFWIFVGIFTMITLFDVFDGHYTIEKFLEFWKFAFIFILAMEAFMAFGYFIYALIMGFSYYVMFDMDDEGVVHTQMPKQFRKAQAMGWIAFVAGMVAKKPGVAGTGMLAASKQSMSSEWNKVKSIEIYRRRGVIKVNSLLNYNQVYAEPEDFDFVEDFIKSHVSDKCKIK